MDTSLVLLILSLVVIGCCTLVIKSATHKTAEALKCLHVVTKELQLLKAVQETDALHADATNISLVDSRSRDQHLSNIIDKKTRKITRMAELLKETRTATYDLRNELNIAMGRLEHLDRLLKTKTNAIRHANGELDKLLTITNKLRKELKSSHERIQHLRSVCTNLRTELKAIHRNQKPTPRGDF